MSVIDRWLGGFDGPKGRMRRSGRIAALCYMAGGAAAGPANVLIAPEQGIVYWMPLLGFVPAAALLVIPWTRLPEWTLHVPVVVGTVILCVSATYADLAYTAFYFFVAIFVAITFPRIWPITVHLTLVSAAMMVPVFLGVDTGRPAIIVAILTIPSLMLVSAIIGYLTGRLEASREDFWALSRQDELTGVGNYRALHERLDEEIARHRRHGRPLGLILLDLDGFKQVNEQFGHLVGDRVLAHVGRALEQGVRAEDSVFRQGGDEFSIVAPETTPEQAEELAMRLRARLGGSPEAPPVAGTTGVAIFPTDGDSSSDLLGIADVRLFAAKREQREARERDPFD